MAGTEEMGEETEEMGEETEEMGEELVVIIEEEGEEEEEGRASGAGGEAMAGSRSSLTTPSNRRTYCPVSVNSSLPNPEKFLHTSSASQERRAAANERTC